MPGVQPPDHMVGNNEMAAHSFQELVQNREKKCISDVPIIRLETNISRDNNTHQAFYSCTAKSLERPNTSIIMLLTINSSLVVYPEKCNSTSRSVCSYVTLPNPTWHQWLPWK